MEEYIKITKKVAKKVAKALTYLDIESIGPVDTQPDIVENICFEAGIAFDDEYANDDEYRDKYLKEKSIEAYTKLLMNDPEALLERTIYYLAEDLNFLINQMMLTRKIYHDVKKHPTAKAIITVNDFVQKIHDPSIYGDDHCKLMEQITEKVSSLDIELCYVGNRLGNRFFYYLNPKYFAITNAYYVTGRIVTEDDNDEQDLGLYVSHAMSQNNFSEGYTIGFVRKDKNILAHLYEYTKTYDPNSIINVDTGCELVVDASESSAIKLADKINELAVQRFKQN